MQSLDLENDVVVCVLKGCDGARHDFQAECGRARDPDAAGTGEFQIVGDMPQPIDIAVNSRDMLDELVRFGRGDQLPLDPIEQAVAQLLFRVREHLGDRRLRNIEHGGGAGHGSARVDRMKDFDLPETHVDPRVQAV